MYQWFGGMPIPIKQTPIQGKKRPGCVLMEQAWAAWVQPTQNQGCFFPVCARCKSMNVMLCYVYFLCPTI